METLDRIGRTYERTNPWPDLVVAMLAVNKFSLAKAFALFEGLDAQGLFDPTNIFSWDQSEIARRLKYAGYDRGPGLTNMFAARIASLGALGDDIAGSERILAHGSKREVEQLLARVKGVGPIVRENFFLLRG